jgi:hypothetical protein
LLKGDNTSKLMLSEMENMDKALDGRKTACLALTEEDDTFY